MNCLPTGVSLGNWLLQMMHKTNPGDELALCLLCRMYNHHAVIITKTGLWTTLYNTGNEGELEIRAKSDICLILIGHGNTGFDEVVHVMPTKTSSKTNKKQQIPGTISVQQAFTKRKENNSSVAPGCTANNKQMRK